MSAQRLLDYLLAGSVALCACCSCGGSGGGSSRDGGCTGGAACGTACCTAEQICYSGSCLPVNGSCAGGAPCPEDSRCLEGRCVAWSRFPNLPYDEKCTRLVKPGIPRPQLQCAWENDPEKASAPTYHAVRHTPLVVDLKLGDADRQLGPSIIVIANATYEEGPPRSCQSSGSLFALDGRSCQKIATGDAPVLATVTPAAADLDGDGRAEIITAAPEGGLLAFRIDPQSRKLLKLWHSSEGGQPSTLGSETCLWGGISVADLDGGSPEILFHGAAHDSTGKLLARITDYKHFAWGNPMVAADVDLDGKPEVVEGFGTFKYTKGSGFSLISGWAGTGGAGFVALADFGDFAGAAGDAPGRPEVVVVSSGLRVQTSLGAVVFSAAGGVGAGGPPTVADFDGDGKPEIGVAFGDQYVVYDLACKGAPQGCAGEGILWKKPSQDKSSAMTGSSVFDFNGDGRAEVVYGDECFVRVYDGPTGEVLFSQGRFSSTWEENAVVADVDGDAAAEIVLTASDKCAPTYCSPLDESFAGLPCKSKEDCPGGSCDSGYCRCVADAECGGSFSCTSPLASTPGTGNVCRTRHEGCSPGVRVYRDARDLWAGSRSIWNQHAYHVTNVEVDGTVLSEDKVKRNWQTAGLNNFRQNVQGQVGPMPAPDLTVKEVKVTCAGAEAILSATVCNRGPAGCDAGIAVSFVDRSGAVVCTTATTAFLDGGQCTSVTCQGKGGSGNVQAVVNQAKVVAECLDGNNTSSSVPLQCLQ